MWKIKQIFDGDFGCEELAPGERPKVSVTLENEEGQTKLVSVEDAWLSDNGLNVGDAWPMQGMLKKLGFTHCGTIYVYEDNDPRLAFEKIM